MEAYSFKEFTLDESYPLSTQSIDSEIFESFLENPTVKTMMDKRMFKDLPDFHSELNVHGQISRHERAKECRVISIDEINKCGVFKGSHRDHYNTSLNSCECRDFELRHRSCKHMFRLAHELGIINIEDCPRGQFYNDSDPMEKYTIGAAKESIEKMGVDERRELYCLLCQWIYSPSQNEWIYERDEPLSNKIIGYGFLQEREAAEKIWPLLKMKDIRAFIKERCGQKCPAKKDDALILAKSMGNEFCGPLIHKYKCVIFDEGFRPIRGKMRSYIRLLLGFTAATSTEMTDLNDKDDQY